MTELYHHGIKGQRWGVRRFQNKDGSYTAAGKKRYQATNGDFVDKYEKASRFDADDMYTTVRSTSRTLSGTNKHYKELDQKISDAVSKIENDPSYYTKKGWKAEQARENYRAKLKQYKNAKGISKAKALIELNIADDVRKRTGKNEILNEIDFLATTEKDRKRNAAINKAVNSFIEEQSGFVLRKLGYEDTKKAREYIKNWI